MHDVIVLGAGLAGLSAARDLAAEGADVVVLEARERQFRDIENYSRILDGRNPALAPATSYVNVYDLSTSDAAQAKWASTSVTWKLRAPAVPAARWLIESNSSANCPRCPPKVST